MTHTIDPVSLKSIGQVVFAYWPFKVLKSVIFKSNIISNNITTLSYVHAKIDNNRLNLSFSVKGHKTDNNAFFL